jgi:hypothetical protein
MLVRLDKAAIKAGFLGDALKGAINITGLELTIILPLLNTQFPLQLSIFLLQPIISEFHLFLLQLRLIQKNGQMTLVSLVDVDFIFEVGYLDF